MRFPSVNVVDCLVVSLFIYVIVVFRDHRRRRGLPYPPGPRPWPIIGNLLDLPNRNPWAAYAAMSERYGDVLCLRLFGQVVVVLSSSSAIKDLLERRGEVYSDRPLLLIHQVLGVDWLLPSLMKGEVWSESRKLLDRSLRPSASASYRRTMEEKTHTFLGQLLVAPGEFRNHLELLQGRLIMSITYGYDVKVHNDKLMRAPVEINKVLAKVVLPGAVMMNHIPFIKQIHSWIPFLSYEEVAKKCRELSWTMKYGPINFVRKSMSEGTAVPSLASEHLQDAEHLDWPERQRQEKIIEEALGSLFNAGAETTVSSMTSFFQALTLYPDVQRRAQAELDLVVGRDRLPTFDDRPRLPYIDAMCKELLRWRMVIPVGFPHAASEDGVYKGFFIPKGATILANAWAILHDPELYPDPESFNPERFLDAAPDHDHDDGGAAGRRQPRINDPSAISLAFGAGKRICPGRHLVDATLFILAASVLAVFNISAPPPKAENPEGAGAAGDKVSASDSGLVCAPGHFGCLITPRDSLAEDLIAANAVVG